MIPLTATYRLQLHREFGFADATRLVPYLQRLGVSHVYLPPVLAARPGSTHGYDVVDPTRANPELGGDMGFVALADAVHAHGMGLIVDIVPNHMGAGPANPYWLDVLALGRDSRWARWFDVDWSASHARGRIVLPVLGDGPEEVLARGELRLAVQGDAFVVRYYEHLFPLDPRTVHELFAVTHTYVFPPHAREDEAEWARLRAGLQGEGGRALDADAASDAVRAASDAVRAATALIARSEAVRAYVEWVLDVFASGDDGRMRLAALLERQRWRLAHWRETTRELHFRRFFDVTELVAVRVEDPAVFEAYHAWTLAQVAAGRIDGLRVDHVDGLADPHAYLRMLRAALDARRPDERVPILVEKILAHGEALRPEWPVDGTTGYEALNEIERVFVSPDGAATLERGYRRQLRARPTATYADVAERGKEHVLRTAFRPELRRLVSLLMRVARAVGVDAKPAAMSEALLQLAIALPVYRTYVRASASDGRLVADPHDRRLLEDAVAHATARGVAKPDVLHFVAGVLLGDVPGDVPMKAAQRRAAHEAALRFQQTSGPATAKGIEDTALYRWFPVASLNEVGGEPDHPLEAAVEELHAANAARGARWPRAMVAATTHDTKRSADVRARLDALAEVPARWNALVGRWHRRHAPLRTKVGRRNVPDANTEWLLYQTLVGIWPEGHDGAADDALVARVQEYLRKAMREAKAQTSWTQPNAAYEDGVLAFARAVMVEDGGAEFRTELASLLAVVAPAGRWTSLARTLLQGAAPGTPDTYRGDELWQLALVDPDNRGPVDWAERKVALVERELGTVAPAELLEHAADGRIKLHVLRSVLQARRAHAALFTDGSYVPLHATGEHAVHVVAFARVHEGRAAIAVAPRLPLGLAPDGAPPVGARWGDTRLDLGTVRHALGTSALRDLVSGGEVPVEDSISLARLLDALPVALFIGD
ncbi:malto-oligosyltrehalose synthase [Roseisolibacter agri]|uniref:Malto-oligosyltrehalose synthase n=1 Tax=Roseisolibacter agri TaxID=2014610 RepID=A0AA37V8R5_9BACT|nr:malto-oligosyltrehalose synthase [Roseisolibacter agri]GLC28076.1 malto-oligosyltrehalose synthase [Roseisolibacter agri]